MRSRRWLAALLVGVGIGFAAGRWSATGVLAPRPAATVVAPSAAWRIVRVIDGDTLVVAGPRGEETVRLRAINTPERGQPGFDDAAAALRELVAGGDIHLEYEDPDRLERDRYGRALGYVFAGTVNASVEMVRLGWSAHETRYGPSRFDADLRAAEREARAAKRGLWR